MRSATDVIGALLTVVVQDGTVDQSDALDEAQAYLDAFSHGFKFDPLVFARATAHQFVNGKPIWVYLADNPAAGNVALALLEAYLVEMGSQL